MLALKPGQSYGVGQPAWPPMTIHRAVDGSYTMTRGMEPGSTPITEEEAEGWIRADEDDRAAAGAAYHQGWLHYADAGEPDPAYTAEEVDAYRAGQRQGAAEHDRHVAGVPSGKLYE